MIRVLIVDDQRLIRDSLRMLFDGADDFEVAGEARDGQQAADEFARSRPDLVLMDLRMPGADGIVGITHIKAQDPDAAVVVLTTFDDDDHLYPALQAGAAGFLAKDIAPEELLDALRRTLTGDVPLSPATVKRLIGQALVARTDAPAPSAAPAPGYSLTVREREVLVLIGQGMSNAEIAGELHLAVTTVKIACDQPAGQDRLQHSPATGPARRAVAAGRAEDSGSITGRAVWRRCGYRAATPSLVLHRSVL